MRPDGILKTLEDAGFEARYVGGCVRDTLLGRPIHDWDIASQALPEHVLRLFPRCVPTGLQHGTVTVLLDGISAEVTTYRLDGAYHDGRHPDGVRFVRSLADDLARRDFTINAMAMDLRGRDHGPLRRPGGSRPRRHPLRRRRRKRASARMRCACCARTALPRSWALRWTPETRGGHRAAARALCAALSRERVREEAEKTLLSDRPELFGRMLEEGLLARLHARRSRRISPRSPRLPQNAGGPVDGRKAAPVRRCEPAGVPPARKALPPDRADGSRHGTTGRTELAVEASHRCARLGNGAPAGGYAAHRRRRQIEARGDCVTLRQLAVTGADFPQLCGRDVGRMLHLLLVICAGAPRSEQQNAPSARRRTAALAGENTKIQWLTFALVHLL